MGRGRLNGHPGTVSNRAGNVWQRTFIGSVGLLNRAAQSARCSAPPRVRVTPGPSLGRSAVLVVRYGRHRAPESVRDVTRREEEDEGYGDLPWNPTRLERRSGRIERFGQKRKMVDRLELVIEQTMDE